MRLPNLLLCGLLFMNNFAVASAAEADFQTVGIKDNMPSFYDALKARLNFQMAWTPAVKD